MWIEFKNYQEKAIVKLKQEVNDLLDVEGNKICIFKSPTGSGKTLMMAEFLKRLIDSRIDGKKFSFIWIAVNKLHDQSRNSLKKYYDPLGIGLKCSYFEDLDERKISENEILFLNWASINKGEKGIITRANERDNNLSTVVARTKDEGRIVILIIDESHHTAKGDESRVVINEIAPKVTIEVSATPQISDANRLVEVEREKVRDEGMTKKEVIVNDGFKNYEIEKREKDETADEIVLKAALKKRIILQKEFESAGSNINPLLLIQLPDTRQGMPDKKADVLSLLKKFGYSTDNGCLAVYLSEKDSKINLENIEKNGNEVEVMIFKQAVALGWDCPRAHILVLFRQWKEETLVFSLQTLGRIMRMPEQKHYSIPSLNNAYLYTSLSDISTKIANDIAADFKVFEGKRRDDYEDIDLTSYHSKRFREETRLSSDFVPIFFQAAEELKLKDRIDRKSFVAPTKIIADGRIADVDKSRKSIENESWFELPMVEVELQNAFDMFARGNLAPFAPELRSIKRINDSLYRFFDKSFKMGVDDWPKIQAIVLAEENRQAVIDVINRAKELYQEAVGKGKSELVQNDEPWNVPEIINYNLNFEKKSYKKSIIQPYYVRVRNSQQNLLDQYTEDSMVEEQFIEYLENANQVKWWFKNGRQDGSYFAVPYVENGQEKPFYLDFVAMLNDGRLGLFDTKGGIYAKTATERAEGLAEYIETENKRGKKLFGGIVLKDKNSWRFNDSKKYSYDSNNSKNWKFLDLN